MSKLLLFIVVIAIVFWMMGARRRKPPPAPRDGGRQAKAKSKPVVMLACAHCGMHLPQDDAVLDAAGRTFCGSAHRLAGPR